MLKIFFLFLILLPVPTLANQGFEHGISIFGDLKYDRNFQHFDYVNPDAPKRGKVRFGVEGGFNSLNQFILKGLPAAGLAYLYDSLMDSSADEISSRYGLVAQGVRLNDAKSTIEFKLRDIAKFHDGKKITADDVVFSFNILRSDGHPSYKMLFRDVIKVEKIKSNLVRFYMKKNHNKDLPLLIASLPVLPKHYYEKIKFDQTTLEAPLGSGPYKIISLKPNHNIIYQRVQNYWAKDLPVNRGRYNFEQINFDYYRDSNVLIEAFKAQKYDLRQENVARNWANAYNIDAVKNGEIIKRKIEHDLPAPIQAFTFNLRKEKFQNLALRKAMTLAFDFEWLEKNIFYHAYKRLDSYFANTEFAYDGSGFKMPRSTGDGFNRQNLIEAAKILEEAGYELHDGKLLDPINKNPLEVEFIIDNHAFEMVIAPFLKNLKKLGINAKMRFVEENQYQTRLNNFDFDIIIAVFPQSLVPSDELFSYWHSSQKNIKGSRNLAGLDDKVIDELVEKISSAKKEAELKKLCQKLDKRMLEHYYLILQWYNSNYRVLYRDIFAMPKVEAKYSLALDSWWVK